MHDDRRFPFEKMAKLDSPERQTRQPAGPLVELVRQFQPRRLLDIGAGTGYFSLPLAEALPPAQIFALDVEPRMLEVVRLRASERGLSTRITPVLAPATQIPLGADEVDLVLMLNLYHELPVRETYLAEVGRVLRAEGHLIICDWDPEGGSEAGPPVDHRLPRATAVAELAAAGFIASTPPPLYGDFWLVTAQRSTAGQQ